MTSLTNTVKARPQETLSKKQDVCEAMRVVFSVLTKCICMHKTTFLRMYSNIVLKVILNLPEYANCNSANYDV